MTLTTLVTGATAAMREAAIAAAISSPTDTAIILEGLPSGTSPLDELATDATGFQLVRIAPGCLCCTGNLTMRVTLNRMLRKKPSRLYIGLASAVHLPQIIAFLSDKPYEELLTLTDAMQA